MMRGQDDTTKDGSERVTPGEDAGAFDRSFRCAVIIYAVVEFFAIALVLYYKLAR
jgi:hypothetical protein